MAFNPYASGTLNRNLYSSTAERNHAFGYDAFLQSRVQNNYHNNAFQNNLEGIPGGVRGVAASTARAPSAYYNQLGNADGNYRGDGSTVIGDMGIVPNLYDDAVTLDAPSSQRPQLYRNWDPNGSKSVAPVYRGATKFVPHAPVEVAPVHDPNLWVADLNAKIYERAVAVGAEPHPNVNYYRRQAMVNMITQNWESRRDPYARPVQKPSETFAAMVTASDGVPPAMMG